jgi:hypothetical protein
MNGKLEWNELDIGIVKILRLENVVGGEEEEQQQQRRRRRPRRQRQQQLVSIVSMNCSSLRTRIVLKGFHSPPLPTRIPSMPEESPEQIKRQGLPLRIAEYSFLLRSGTLSSAEQSETLSKLVDASIELDNASCYVDAMNSFGFMGDDSVVDGMRARNAAKLAKIEAEIMDAKENLGEEEVRQSMFAKATALAETGDTKAAIAVFDEIEAQKKTTTGQKVDIAFSKLRIAFAADDLKLMSKTIEKAKEYVEVGGDWERRNRLKVYEAVFFTRTRHFSEAANMYAATPSER